MALSATAPCYTGRVVSYALQVQKIPLRLVTLSGTEIRGDLFLQAATSRSGRRQTISDRLAEGGRFLPLAAGDRVRLVRAKWIAYLEVEGVPPEVAELEEIGACRAAVELELVTAETLRGDLLYLLPAGSNRVSDLLNAPGSNFLLLVSENLTRYVNRDALAWFLA